MKYLINTDILLSVLKGDKSVADFVASISKADQQAVSLLSVVEVLSQIPESKKKIVEKFLKAHQLLSINFEISQTAGELWEKYRGKDSSLTRENCLIIAQAKYYDLDLLTNKDKFKIFTEIKVIIAE